MGIKTTIVKTLLSKFFGDGTARLMDEAKRIRNIDQAKPTDIELIIAAMPSARRLASAGFICIRQPNIIENEKGFGVVTNQSFRQNKLLLDELKAYGDWELIDLRV